MLPHAKFDTPLSITRILLVKHMYMRFVSLPREVVPKGRLRLMFGTSIVKRSLFANLATLILENIHEMISL